jgi:hypothetical protein
MGMNNMNMNNMNNMNIMGMNNMGMGMNNMNMMAMNNMNNMNMMRMNNMNNMNMMGMNNMGMGMPNMNMMAMNMAMQNANINNEDKDGWELTFKYDDGKDKKDVVVKVSCEKTVNEAISLYKLKVANTEDMRFEYPPNKELNRTLKISQSGLSNKSEIIVKPREDKSKKNEEKKEDKN